LFQSTRPRGARREEATTDSWNQGFNPRARVGRDVSRSATVPVRRVSIHAPAWGATWPFRKSIVLIPRFNPRARVGRDTHDYHYLETHHHVSIHAPAWGATLPLTMEQISSTFQSTRPRGARPESISGLPSIGVSIHAPAWGATWKKFKDGTATLFQSTRPRGARLSRSRFGPSLRSFNPRARVGRDKEANMAITTTEVSIHAPAWGATERTCTMRWRGGCFNPRARVGRDGWLQFT